MNLDTHKNIQLGSSPVPTPGSPSVSHFQTSTNNQQLADSIGKEGKRVSRSVEKHQKSVDVQRPGNHDLGARAEIGSRPDTVSFPDDRSRVNVSLNRTTTTQTNGELGTGYSPTHAEQDQIHHETNAPEPVQQSREELSEISSEVTNLVRRNGFAQLSVNPPSGQLINGAVHADSSSTAPAPTFVDSNTTISSRSSSLPVPTASLTSESSRAASSNPDNNGMLVDTHQHARPNYTQIDDTEPLARRTRSRQKRASDSLTKEPTKRARTSSSATGTTSSATSVRGNGKVVQDGGLDVKMHDPPTAQKGGPLTSGISEPRVDMNTKATQASSSSLPMIYGVSEPRSSASSAPITVNTNLNPNLDPALSIPSNSAQQSVEFSQSTPNPSNPPGQPTIAVDKAPVSTPLGSTEQAKPSPNSNSPIPGLTSNPYAGLSTALLKGTTGHSYNPYSLYYGPGTPITPHTPTYPYPYFYHLQSPVSAQAMYPASPSFTASPTSQKSPSASSPNSGDPHRQKPKRLKAHTVTSGNHNIPIVPRDKKGKPMLPLNVGIMTVIGLGEVCIREHFHTERYIFPVGYEVTRRYLSTMDPTAEVVYHCTILDGGDGPKFQIVPSDAPDRTVIAGTATGAWSSIVKQANAIRNRQHSNSVSGPDFFGLGQNTIKHLIQELPGADRLRDYVWQNFIEGGPLGGRHAAVTPALPEDYDSTLPIGALYPAERDRLKREASLNSPQGLRHYPQHIIAQAEAQRRHAPAQGSLDAGVATPDQSDAVDASLSPPLDTQVPIMNGHVTSPPQQPAIVPSAVPQDHSLSQPPSISTTNSPNIRSSPSTVPTTIASIMNAYPIPTQAAPSASTSVPTPTPSS